MLELRKTKFKDVRDIFYKDVCIGHLFATQPYNKAIKWSIDLYADSTVGNGYLYSLSAAKKEINSYLKSV